MIATETTLDLSVPQSRYIASTKRYKHADGPYRCGKTWALLWAVVQHCLYYDGKNGRGGPARVYIIKETYSALLDSIVADFQTMCDIFCEELVSFPKSPPNVQATFKNGSKVFFRPADDPVTARRRVGATLSMLAWDQIETCDPATFSPFNSRVSMKNVICQTLTTSNPEGHDWVWRKFIDPTAPLVRAGSVEMVQFHVSDNEANLPPGWLEDQKNSMTAQEIKQYLEGSREDFSGLIYPMYREGVHVIDDFEPPATWKKYRGIDFGVTSPTTCLCVAISPQNQVVVYDEYYAVADTLMEHIDRINEMCGDTEFEAGVIDPSCINAHHDKYGRSYSIRDEFVEAGIDVIPGTRDWDSSTSFLRWLMKVNPVTGKPRILFTRRCPNILKEFTGYRTKDSDLDAAGRMYGRDGAHKGADHAIDPTRYVAAYLRPKFIEYDSPEAARKLTPEEYEDAHCWESPGGAPRRELAWQSR